TARSRNLGQCRSGKICSAKLSAPSRLLPRRQTQTPPRMLLQAEPDPWRARIEHSRSSHGRPAAARAATESAANAAALLASPAAGGNAPVDSTRTGPKECRPADRARATAERMRSLSASRAGWRLSITSSRFAPNWTVVVTWKGEMVTDKLD